MVNKALEKEPDKRYQQIDDLLDDFKSISAGIVPEEIKARLRKAKISRTKRTIMTGSAIIVVLIILGLFILPRIFHPGEEPEKSVAVVPFHYLSDDPDRQYLADGVMDAILLNLSKIEDLRVVSRTSVEQYRNTDKTVNTICQELDVAYLLEGSFQKYGDTAMRYFELAVDKDPEFADAYVGIAGVWVWRQQFMTVSADEAARQNKGSLRKSP